MLYRTRQIFLLLTLAAACVTPLSGCASKSSSSQDDAQLRAALTLLGMQYSTYLAETGAAPPDEPAFRKYIQSRMPLLNDYGVKSVDDLLRLGRDGQPLRLIYRIKVPLLERPEYFWVAHEQVGIAGKRLACDSRGGVYEITDTEYSQQLASK